MFVLVYERRQKVVSEEGIKIKIKLANLTASKKLNEITKKYNDISGNAIWYGTFFL